MKNLINRLAVKVTSSAEDEQKRHKYEQMQAFDGWKTHQEYLLTIRGLMAEELLSDAFSALKPLEKDSIQRAYAMVDQMIIFLLDPLVKARRMVSIQAHNKKYDMGATVPGATERTTK